MGKALSIISKPARDFNLESRAHKIISKDKPVPAPRHQADIIDYERIKKDYPEVYDDSLTKNEQLDKHLKDIYVVSRDPQTPIDVVEKSPQNPDRPLPLDRKTVEMFEMGFKEPTRVPIGKVSLRKALQFITDHHADPKVYSSTKIAEDYVLSENKVQNILKYFRLFEIYIPEQRKVKANFAGPSIPRTTVTKSKRKALPEPAKKDDT